MVVLLTVASASTEIRLLLIRLIIINLGRNQLPWIPPRLHPIRFQLLKTRPKTIVINPNHGYRFPQYTCIVFYIYLCHWSRKRMKNTMELHFSADALSQGQIRKLRSVFAAAGAKVKEVGYKTGDDLSKISFGSALTLSLLETPEMNIFSSNTIIRYVATTYKRALYGGDNQHNQTLIDQWLDGISLELEPATRAILKQIQGEKVDLQKPIQDINQFLSSIEKHLSDKKFLVGDSLSIADLSLASSVSVVFSTFFGEDRRKQYPNTLNWYTAIATRITQVGPAEFPKETHKVFKSQKKQEKPVEEEQKIEDLHYADKDDLFRNIVAPTPSKSAFLFYVKVYEQETDLNELFKKITAISVDGLVWNKEIKIVPVAFGMSMLQVECVIEDDKVSMYDLAEQIEEWDEVQSTEPFGIQKL